MSIGGLRRGRLGAALAGLLVIAAACSGGDDSTASTTEAPATTITSLSTTDPVEPSAPGTTDPASTTSPSTSAPPVTAESVAPPPTPPDVPPPSTDPPPSVPSVPVTPPLDQDESAVAAAYTALWDAWAACLDAIPECDRDSLGAHWTGDYLLMTSSQVRDYIEGGFTFGDTDQRWLTIESIEIEPSGEQATVISCEAIALTRYNAAGEVIRSGVIESVRRVTILLLEAGVWKAGGLENLEAGELGGESLCES